MIYLISDIHGDKNFRGLKEYAANAGEEDLLIILGDVGLAFEKTEENREFTQFFLGLQKPIAIVDGNHENFAFLNSFPEEECVFALANLAAYSNRVDYILTHKYETDPPVGTVSINLQKLTAEIEQKVSYRTGYAGHWHMRRIVDERHELVYEEPVALMEKDE